MSDRVSVVMTVRDGERYLAEAIDSILAQTRPPDEVVVVDDGSTDATIDILSGYGDAIVVRRQEPLGMFAGVNHGLRVATGDVVGFLDADDVFVADSIEVRLAVLAEHADVDIVYGQAEQFISPELPPEASARFRVDTAPVAVALFQSMLVRRRVFDVVGMLDESRATASNIDWVARARAAQVRQLEIPVVVARRRIHLWNTGVTQPDQTRANLLAVVRAHRRRSTAASDEA